MLYRASRQKTHPLHVLAGILVLGAAAYLLSKADITGRIHRTLP